MMKTRISMFLLLAFLIYGCGEQAPSQKANQKPDYSTFAAKSTVEETSDSKKKGKSTPQQTAQQATAQPTATPKTLQIDSKAQLATPASTTGSTVDSVMNYGTGATALSIKQKSAQKLKNIQDTHNAATQKALKDN